MRVRTARAKLLIRDRFDDVVIRRRRPDRERWSRCRRAPNREARRVPPVPPQLLKNLESVPVSQLQIENDSVVFVHQRQRARFLAVDAVSTA